MLFGTVLAAVLLQQAYAAEPLKPYKAVAAGNPISPCVFCADPTALVYDGRLYVYGTNDHQQFLVNNKSGSNGYGNIKSLVVFSTDDMMNWTFHGTIDVGTVCGSWCGQSWAPSAVWREGVNGKPEFFIYFANGGGSVGVIKGSSPIGPFTSPLNKALITHGMPGVDPCNWVFDPGVVIDDNGTGWIAFGGGDPQSTGSDLMPGNSRIAKLKKSMIALDGSAVNLPAPYLFEASELNVMNGKLVYTYNTSWSGRNAWSSYAKRGSNAAPSSCSMCYMVTDDPLNPDAWEYRGEYFANPGSFGFGYGNNHTHLQQYEGDYYLFYHSMVLEQTMNTGASGFRSIGVNKATVNEKTQRISKVTATQSGVPGIRNLNPFVQQQAETMSTAGGVSYEDFSNISTPTAVNKLGNDASKTLQVRMAEGAWTMVRKADFGDDGVSSFTVRARGTGVLEIRLNSLTAKAAARLEFSSSTYKNHTIEIDTTAFTGVRNIYFVFTEATNVLFDSWQFAPKTADDTGIEEIDNSQFTNDNSQQPLIPAFELFLYDLSGRRVDSSRGIAGQARDEEAGMRGQSSKRNGQSSKLPKGIYIQNGRKHVVR